MIQRSNELEEDSLLKLYWNRAGVKRELVNLKREHFDLLEKLEQQEGAILRAQSQLEGLERLLTNPLAAANAMVYFQLRHLWRVAALKVQQFGKELKSQREKRERVQLHNAVLAKRNRRLQAIKEKLDDLLQKRKLAIEEALRLEKRLERMNFIVKFFAGRSMRNRLHGMKQNRAALEERIEEFNDIIEKIQGEPLPEPDGLSLENRRLINLAIIALAQHLVVHFSEHDLARLARKATKRTVADMKFGDRRVCDQMVERVREKIEELNNDKRLADHVKRRTDLLVNKVKYRHETDAAPMQAGLAEIVISPDREMQGQLYDPPLRANVLEDDFWDLSQVLL
ncbi:MAG TPA: hypothetical protein VMR74_06510 [Gammaproteobacteria bacterium]|nr:hypothetical protein [Gammaproteobacteria bacterium]